MLESQGANTFRTNKHTKLTWDCLYLPLQPAYYAWGHCVTQATVHPCIDMKQRNNSETTKPHQTYMDSPGGMAREGPFVPVTDTWLFSDI
jgi:hypothetical protein